MSDREFLIEANIQDVLKYIIADFDLSITDAMRQFYVSEVFAKLQNQDTGLYLESLAYIYDLYQNEMRNSRLVQEEQ
jgi:hypothetical protein